MSSRLDDIADWLLVAGQHQATLRELTHELILRLHDAGIPLTRANLGVFALHPEMAGYAVSWEQGMAEPIEFPVTHEDTLTPTYLDNPIKALVKSGEPLYFDLEDPADGHEYPVLAEFQAKGNTDYRGFAIQYGKGGVAALTLCTNRPGGFESWQLEGITSLFSVLRLLVELVETRRFTRTVLSTYLGRHTGTRVLEGKIHLGQGEAIDAALWLCDLRGFTAMTASLGSMGMIEVVNLYFDCMAEAVWEEGGEILKFMGDAMLVVFRITESVTAVEASRRAMRAAQGAQRRLSVLSGRRAAEGLDPLRAGIAVHLGRVVYGNIGARTRLDFTVMGNSVNLVARIQSLTGDLDEPVLFSPQVAEHLEDPVQSVGEHLLKGVEHPVEIFRLDPSAR
jgi:adenylate cyclase